MSWECGDPYSGIGCVAVGCTHNPPGWPESAVMPAEAGERAESAEERESAEASQRIAARAARPCRIVAEWCRTHQRERTEACNDPCAIPVIDQMLVGELRDIVPEASAAQIEALMVLAHDYAHAMQAE